MGDRSERPGLLAWKLSTRILSEVSSKPTLAKAMLGNPPKTPEEEQDADPGREPLAEQGGFRSPWALVETFQDQIVDGYARDASAKIVDAIRIVSLTGGFPPASYCR
jgi:hypothetical protein